MPHLHSSQTHWSHLVIKAVGNMNHCRCFLPFTKWESAFSTSNWSPLQRCWIVKTVCYMNSVAASIQAQGTSFHKAIVMVTFILPDLLPLKRHPTHPYLVSSSHVLCREPSCSPVFPQMEILQTFCPSSCTSKIMASGLSTLKKWNHNFICIKNALDLILSEKVFL